MVTMNGRAPGNITKAQLQGIYNCSITTWDQITGNGADAGKVIQPVGMNAASGTNSTFQSYLGFDPNAGACVKKLSNGQFPLENDTKPVLADAGIDSANAIWWMSFAEWKSYPYKRQSAQFLAGRQQVAHQRDDLGQHLADHPLHLPRREEDDGRCSSRYRDVTGSVGGAQGGVRASPGSCAPRAPTTTRTTSPACRTTTS